VTDNTYRGGHGADTVLRSTEALTKSTEALAEPHHTMAEDYERSGHPLDAVHEFQRAAELDASETNLFDWATELLKHGAPQQAAEVFMKGAKLFPHSERTLLGLATAYYAAGEYERARDWFFKAVDLDPNDARPYAFLSTVQRREITDAAGFQERLARFARLQPENALANYYYALSLCNQHSYKNARPLLMKAVRLDPHLGNAYLQLGIIAQDKQEAIADFEKAIQASPELEEAHYRLSEAYRVGGNAERAKEEMAIYQRLSNETSERIERERAETKRFVIGLPGH
jgi:tetratricopeptide (TPR) repeat protein